MKDRGDDPNSFPFDRLDDITVVWSCSCPASKRSWQTGAKYKEHATSQTPNTAIAVIGIDIGKNLAPSSEPYFSAAPGGSPALIVFSAIASSSVRVSMTRHTIVDVVNSSLRMLCTHSVLLMLVAPEARVLLVVAVAVARRAARTMVLVEDKEFAVVKCRGFPMILAVALGAGGGLRTMELVLGHTVTCSTLIAHSCGQ